MEILYLFAIFAFFNSCLSTESNSFSSNSPVQNLFDTEFFQKDNEIAHWIPYRKGDEWIFVNQENQTLLSLSQKYGIVFPFDHGLAMIAKGDCYGFIDQTGQEVIPCQFDQIHDVLYYGNNPNLLRIRKRKVQDEKNGHRNNHAAKKWTWKGYNRKTQVLTKDYYEYPIGIKQSYGKSPSVYFELDWEKHHHGKNNGTIFRVKVKDQWIFLDKEMLPFSSSVYEEIFVFKKGFMVKEKGNYSLISPEGKLLKNFDFEEVQEFIREQAWKVSRKGKVGLMNLQGEMIVPLECDSLVWRSHEFIELYKNGKVGRANRRGELIIPIKFDKLYNYDPNKYSQFVKIGNKICIVEKKNWEQSIETPFNEFKPFRYGGFLVQQNGKWGLLRNDSLILKTQFDEIRMLSLDHQSTDLYAVKKEGKWGVQNEEEQMIFPQEADSIISISNHSNYSLYAYFKFIKRLKYENLVQENQAFAFIKKNGYWGMIDEKGAIQGAIVYDKIESFFFNKLFKVQKEGKWGLIDNKGKVVLPIEETTNFRLRGYESEEGFLVKLDVEKGLTCFFLEKQLKSKDNEKIFSLNLNPSFLQKYACDSHPPVLSSKRAAGTQGPAGPAGSKGAQGLPAIGVSDEKGPFGLRKGTGFAGSSSPSRPAGASGPAGPVGVLETVGPSGPNSMSGPAGPVGASPNGFSSPYQRRAKIKDSLNLHFDKVLQWSHICFLVKDKRQWASYTLKGELIQVLPYEDLGILNVHVNSYILGVKINGKWGVVDHNGEQVIEPIYDIIYPQSARSYFVVGKEDKLGLIDRKNRVILPFIYEQLELVLNKKQYHSHFIKTEKGEGLLHQSKIIEPQYGHISFLPKNCREDLILDSKNGQYGFITWDGKTYFSD